MDDDFEKSRVAGEKPGVVYLRFNVPVRKIVEKLKQLWIYVFKK